MNIETEIAYLNTMREYRLMKIKEFTDNLDKSIIKFMKKKKYPKYMIDCVLDN